MTKVLDCWNLSAGAECQVGTLRWSPWRRIHGPSPSVSHLPSGSRSTCGGPLLGTTPWRVAVSMGRPVLVMIGTNQSRPILGAKFSWLWHYSILFPHHGRYPKKHQPINKWPAAGHWGCPPSNTDFAQEALWDGSVDNATCQGLVMSYDVSCGKLSCCDFGCFSGPDPIPPDGYVKVNGFSPQGEMMQQQQFTDFTDFSSPFKKTVVSARFLANLAKSWQIPHIYPQITAKLYRNQWISAISPMFFCDVFTKTEGMDLQRGHASWNGGAPLSSTGQAMGDWPFLGMALTVKNGYSSILWNSNMMDIWIWWISKDFHIQNGARMITAAHFEYTYRSYSWLCPECFGMSWSEKSLELWISPIKSTNPNGMIGCQRCLREPELVGCHELSAVIPQIPEILGPCGPCGPWVISEVVDCSSVLHQICPIPVPWNRVRIWEDLERLQGCQRNGCFEAVREPYQESSVLRENSMVSLCTYSSFTGSQISSKMATNSGW